LEARHARRRHVLRRVGRVVAGLLLLAAVGVLVAGVLRGTPGRGPARAGGPGPAGSPGPAQAYPAVPTVVPSGVVDSGVPQSGPGTFAFATGTGAMLGPAGGKLRTYRVAVENSAGQQAAGFAAEVQQTLGDPRGWTAGGQVRFQRVPQATTADFTIYLATPATTDTMCAAGGLHTLRYTSCRLPGQIVINLARWLVAVPGYGAPLQAYRQFAVNHEIGRELGYGNQTCPGPRQPAPVMQQQTLGLAGCEPNPWPYLGGVLYQGHAIP